MKMCVRNAYRHLSILYAQNLALSVKKRAVGTVVYATK